MSGAGVTGASAHEWPGKRLRSEGPLNAAEIAWCKANDVELGYDPVQQGVVPLHCIDDIVGTEGAATGSRRLGQSAPDQLIFRRWRATDADIFARLLGNEQVWRYLPERFPGALDRASALDLIALSNEADHHDVYAVACRGEVVGQARLLFDVAAEVRETAEISYWLGEPYWGQKLGSRIVADFTRDSFSRWPDLRSIVARVHKQNHASARVLMKAGYRAEPDTPSDAWRLYRFVRADVPA